MLDRIAVREKTKIGASDLTMLPAELPDGAILFVVRDEEVVRCMKDLSNVERGERVYCVRQLAGG